MRVFGYAISLIAVGRGVGLSGDLAVGSLVEVSGVSVRFGSLLALDNLSLRVMPMEVFGLLGPNGAGKTTTIKLLMGLVVPSSGDVKVCGFDPLREPVDVKSRIGYVAENSIVYESCSHFSPESITEAQGPGHSQ